MTALRSSGRRGVHTAPPLSIRGRKRDTALDGGVLREGEGVEGREEGIMYEKTERVRVRVCVLMCVCVCMCVCVGSTGGGD